MKTSKGIYHWVLHHFLFNCGQNFTSCSTADSDLKKKIGVEHRTFTPSRAYKKLAVLNFLSVSKHLKPL